MRADVAFAARGVRGALGIIQDVPVEALAAVQEGGNELSRLVSHASFSSRRVSRSRGLVLRL